MSNKTAVITAGGSASRCGGGQPKSLMRIGRTTYLEALLIEVAESGIDDVVIYCNRPDYLCEIEYISNQYCNTKLMIDKGVNSTFALAKHAATFCKGNDVVFLYGHSPHPSTHLKKILCNSAEIVVSLFRYSSKHKPIKWCDHSYIEPPFKISSNLINATSNCDWYSFFREYANSIESIPNTGVSEFNSLEERSIFEDYLCSWFNKWPNKANSHGQKQRGFRLATATPLLPAGDLRHYL